MKSGRGANMRRETFEQPEILAGLIEREWPAARALGKEIRRSRPHLILMAARGSSDHAAILGKYVLEYSLGVPVALAAPSMETLYHRSLRLKGVPVIGISQSGRSPDIVEYVREARRAGALTIAVTNDTGSPLAEAAGRCLELHAGDEHLVATKTFTTQIACLYLLAAGWMGESQGAALLDDLKKVPEATASALKRDADIQKKMEELGRINRCSVIGRGFPYPVALEAALKFKEAAGLFTEGASAADYLHGPIAMAQRQSGGGFVAFLLKSRGPGLPSMRRVERKLRLAGISSLCFGPPPVPDIISPFPLAVFVQLAACHLALLRGLDPDHPAGLHKVTRVR
jgi:glucosamine--fructose-6-phosphate aminotransferase (isomerizing)